MLTASDSVAVVTMFAIISVPVFWKFQDQVTTIFAKIFVCH